jgi:RNA polymerase sigma-70 factor (ECF subfamily)
VSTGGTWDPGVGDGPSDVDLVAAVGDRDHAALGEIYRRHGAAVWSVATQVCPTTGQAEEVAAAVFAELWAQPGRFGATRGGLRAWLVAQAHARAVAVVRSGATVTATPPSAEVETAAHAEGLPAEARRALDKLPAAERDAILLTYVGGHTCAEAARLLGLPEPTIKSSIRRGLLNLRGALDAEGVSR